MTDMTEEQIKAAAYELCKLRGLDPEQSISHGPEPDARGIAYAILLHSPRWVLAAREIANIYNINQAIKIGLCD